jgi:anti-sigma B factor antagonist
MKLSVTRADTATVVKVAGEIDITTVAEMEEFLSGIDPTELVVDLSEVTFMDTSGVHLLVGLLGRSDADTGEMTLVVAPGSAVDLLIRLTGLTHQFNIVESIDAVIGS